MTKSTSILSELLEACAQPGCPICRLAEDAARRSLVSLFYESVNDVGMREHLRKSLGFCREHAWQVLEPGIGDALGVSIIYHDILRSVLKDLPGDPQHPHSKGLVSSLVDSLPHRQTALGASTVKALTPRAGCPACETRDSTARLYIQALVESIDQEQVSSVLSNSDGLCLPHLQMTFELHHGSKSLGVLLAISREKLLALQHELSEFIRKNDYRFRGERIGSERDAWRRATARLVGERLNKHVDT